MSMNRRTALASPLALVGIRAPYGSFGRVAQTVLIGGEKAILFGTKVWKPIGISVALASSAQANPYFIWAALVGALSRLGLSESKRRELEDPSSWTPRAESSDQNFHDRYAANSIVTAPYRSIEQLNGGAVADLRSGRVSISGPMNKGQFEKDISESEAKAMAGYGIFPKSNRVIPNAAATAHLAEAWRIMRPEAGAQKVSYMREFSDEKGQEYVVGGAKFASGETQLMLCSSSDART